MKALFLPLICIFSLVITTSAQSQQSIVIDEIIALVEDDVITRNELVDEVTRIQEDFRKKGRNLQSSPELNGQVLELMITKSILLQEADKRGVKITDTQLNNAMQRLARNNQMNLSQFRQALITNGIDYNDFRDQMRRDLTIDLIRDRYARQNIDITDREVDDFLQRTGEDNDSAEFWISHLLIALPDGANSEQVTAAREKTHELIAQLDQGADFADLASRFSEASDALNGGDLGWRKLAQTPSLFAALLPGMEPGGYSQPLRSPSGFHILRLNDKRNSEQVLINQTNARHILIRQDELTNAAVAQARLEEIRQQIIDGADFAEMAREHSADPGSKGLGGDLGWFERGKMVAEFQKVVDATSEGEISPVFQSSFGWHIVQVIGRRTQDETEEAKREKIRRQIEAQKKDEVLELWQRRLRDEAFIKVYSG